jgi:hypothetical protein
MTFARVLASLALLVAAALAASAGCQAIVPNEVPAYTCAMTPYVNAGNGTCPRGMYCKGSGCTACETKDICDGYDNDCDGIIDDGPYSDHDGDGYTFCGKVDANSGQLVDVDCNDNDKTIYPGGHEVCNGKDDNCDGIIDNPLLVCPADETCVPKTGQCISNAQACTTASCASPNVCDPGTQQCVPPGTQDAGSSCSGDVACATGICGDPAEFGGGIPGGTCTKPCCTSADCDPGSICWGAGTGGNYCLDAATANRAAPGAGAPGASCNGNTDCRSGVCTANACEDTCCSDADCSGGGRCSATSFAGNTTLACVPPPGAVPPNQECQQNSDCVSGVCPAYTAGGGVDFQACAKPCCSSKQCGSLLGVQLLCFDDFIPPATSGPVVPVCDNPQQGSGRGNVGDACPHGNGDCFAEQCAIFGSSHFCTDVCCTDSDCGTPGWVCRPTQQGSGTYLRCVPTPPT